ncbi:hypothetical protein ACJX0J_011055, partial [Zea mays]
VQFQDARGRNQSDNFQLKEKIIRLHLVKDEIYFRMDEPSSNLDESSEQGN